MTFLKYGGTTIQNSLVSLACETREIRADCLLYMFIV